ncbi:MAG: phosphotransferase family protein [Pseudomonas sp.]|nr:phosphotransferase family protein [Pseudomonas sp.]MBB50960.1 phosphotransferase family protein [Pseudomonadales bacterium]MBO08532.1 phosphotransferase family protein [Acidobacteriota bacterium]|tara:strand:- start:2176 stop:3222 length:1047 start_codon:yes stop_codon:yes gene_type:complete
MSGATLIDVLPAHQFDEAKLANYLQDYLPGANQGITVKQFQGGQSNPTFLLDIAGKRYVLRKKPPGKLLPSAHMVEREFQVINALGKTDVPVPTARLLCEDPEIIGTAFYVMDYVEGRVYSQPLLAEVAQEERMPIYQSMIDTMARMHNADWKAIGLEGYGKPDNYIARQVKRWGGQFEASRTHDMPAMDALMKWLPENIPADQSTTIAHGDFRIGNLMLDPTEPKVVSILDWELATLGHPLSDLAYCCLPYHMPVNVDGAKGMVGADLKSLGLPEEQQLLDWYCQYTGRTGVPNWNFYIAFSLFRLAAIVQGVYHRALQGNASNADALEVGKRAGLLAERGWEIAQK